MKPWILITPASRGIGLSIARRLLRTTDLPIIATARQDLDKAREAILTGTLREERDGYEGENSSNLEITEPIGSEREWSKRLEVIRLDFADEASIVECANFCQERFALTGAADAKSNAHLHLAFVLAGKLYPEKSAKELEYHAVLDTFKTNTIGPMLILKHFHSFLPRKATPVVDRLGSISQNGSTSVIPTTHATWATMSARIGSITDNNRLGGWYSYRASKAAVNQITKTFDNQLRMSAGSNAAAISLHPGTVKTELSREFWGNVAAEKLFSPRFAAKRLLDVVSKLDIEKGRGRCWDWAGEEIPP